MNPPVRPFPWKCATCRERAVQPIVVDYTTEMEHDGRSYPVTVPGLAILKCQKCQAQVLTDDAYSRLTDAFRRQVGLLSPAEVRQKRKDLGLSQQELADYLQVAMATVSRWETGSQIQQRSLDCFLRAFFELRELREFLKRRQTGGSPHPAAPSDVAMTGHAV
jgi:putative zinc finger/helix-turn-helix YgiT family protein